MVTEKTILRVAVYSTAEYVHEFLIPILQSNFTKVKPLSARLDADTALLAKGYDAVCLFVNDICDAEVIETLAEGGVRFIAMRCAGYDRVDLEAAARHGIRVVRVPSYSPRSVAEMALALIMAAARNLRVAAQKVAIGNYEASGLVGWEVSGKTYGIIGTGKIGIELIKLLKGFGGRILAYDVYQSDEAKALGVEYVEMETVLRESDIVSLHTPLLPSTRHLINAERLAIMKNNSILVNVSRGGLVDSEALINHLKNGSRVAAVALDVYEYEDSLFFEDLTKLNNRERMKLWDNNFAVLKSLPQVIVTPHVAFLTHEALQNIADTTVENLKAAALGEELVNELKFLQK